MKSHTKLIHTDVKVGDTPEWDKFFLKKAPGKAKAPVPVQLGSHTAFTRASVNILSTYSSEMKILSKELNAPLRTRCFYQQLASKSSTWSSEEGKCKECSYAKRQCFYYIDAETIRIMGE